jgi:hypothetical protein
MTEFDEIIDTAGLSPEEAARLRRVHELLVEAGPPPDLPPTLEHPTEPTDAEIVQFPHLPRRRLAVGVLVAAAVALLGFGGGYLLGHSKAKTSTFSARRVVSMHGQDSLAVLRIGWRDSAGNWPMELGVSGLPKQRDPQAYYELWLTRNGKPVVPCGSFRVTGTSTTVRLSVPYTFSRFNGWVVTAQPAHAQGPGLVVLKT